MRSLARSVGVLMFALLVTPVHTAAPATPILFGAYTQLQSGESRSEAITSLEGAIGRPLAIVRVYYRWDAGFPGDYERWLRDSGHTLFMSVRAQRADGSIIRWRDIANAEPGSALHDRIIEWADRIKGFGAPLYFAFHHEPEIVASSGHGGADDFIAAWQKVITVFREQGVTNAEYVWTMTAYAFARQDTRAAPNWYPGDGYVDHFGADAYNFYTCRPDQDTPWRSLGDIIEPFRQFGLAHPDKGLFLPEWGSVEDPQQPGRKAGWIDYAREVLAGPGYEQLRGVMYWDAMSHNYAECDWRLGTSSTALAAFGRMGLDPAFISTGPPSVTSFAPTRGASGTTVEVAGANFVDVTSVSVGGTDTTFFVSALDRLTATVPQGATGGPIQIVTPFGTAASAGAFTVVHPREARFRIGSHGRAAGAVGVPDGYEVCASGVLVQVQRREDGKWKGFANVSTSPDGSFRVDLGDAHGRYRAVVKESVAPTGVDVCARGRSRTVRHRG